MLHHNLSACWKVFSLVFVPVAIAYVLGIPFDQISLWCTIISIAATNCNTWLSIRSLCGQNNIMGGKSMKYAIKTMAVNGICGVKYWLSVFACIEAAQEFSHKYHVRFESSALRQLGPCDLAQGLLLYLYVFLYVFDMHNASQRKPLTKMWEVFCSPNLALKGVPHEQGKLRQRIQLHHAICP